MTGDLFLSRSTVMPAQAGIRYAASMRWKRNLYSQTAASAGLPACAGNDGGSFSQPLNVMPA
jgi:hypothetical protein